MRTFYLFVVLVGISVMIANVLKWQIENPVDTSPIVAGQIDSSILVESVNPDRSGRELLSGLVVSEITARPLFNRDRQKFSAPAPPAPPKKRSVPKIAKASPKLVPRKTTEKVVHPQFILHGISIGNGRRRALLAVKGKEPTWVNPGEQYMGWTLERISSNNAVMKNGEYSARLDLYRSANK